ncbi:SUR7/PalI family-domain-containing protein [Aspergillus coremiiformis]|uniref:SUR7/PalI family-domain-containing protein n=1 Tax=Aspergillus coremiiformis TaxID=138285 RepID=A0A5N6ZB81_9EURO|nr:SUR7/PalI family-domain-containing protein [Aspergillus coremiiformis]
MANLAFFRKSKSPQPPVFGRSHSKTRRHRLLRSLLYLVAWIFLILILTANVSNKPVLRQTYFLKVDLSNIIPLSLPNAVLINSIARSIGLHDFYQVGLWNFCEGYNDSGITKCSKPKTLYSFNPVEIILSELLSGATIALPGDISDALKIARIASHWMFALFILSTILTFVMIFLSPLATSSRPPQTISPDPHFNAARPAHRRRTFIFLRAVPFLLLSFFTALFTVVATIVATVMFIIFKNVFTSEDYTLNIKAELGTRMLAFMWIASACNLLSFIVQLGSCCAACCGGRTARKMLKNRDLTGVSMHEKDLQSPTTTVATG